ncbi:pentatricopeptide repeat-containing protein At3g53360, mitochondrial-like [Selaginella moellendorffii]|uniref:pentatricopeptide repeat-containing protein At3g53360, mitochondrial-like n=1 Tax=Selaginella moellendorffii TaxID=88036 RepID=UPI000D1CA366|nr:pentatricopeptide repeat-containing protein At3g53360, mitochondrial-like [Selaginella moellendorffii]|eukprot:XP_024516173.1 pentatricopeptide repeat-containing protein At3g53360, mitochondrial-like [Selaginella moellendorffii]
MALEGLQMRVSDKLDIYNFGILVLKVATGLQAFHTCVSCGILVVAEVDRHYASTISQSQCGYLGGARLAFEATTGQDVVSWNGIISAYANNGHFDETFDLFWRMKHEGLDPDEVTIVSVLCACSHAGLFESAPNLEHFMCVIDLLGRTGRLDEVQEVIDSMSIEPGSIAYMTLLGACKTHGNNRLGNMAGPSAIARASGASTYVFCLIFV